MFHALRRRLTLLYAVATLVLLAILGIGMVVWLNYQFTQAADAALRLCARTAFPSREAREGEGATRLRG